MGGGEKVQSQNLEWWISTSAALASEGEGRVSDGDAFYFVDWRLKLSVIWLLCKNNITRKMKHLRSTYKSATLTIYDTVFVSG